MNHRILAVAVAAALTLGTGAASAQQAAPANVTEVAGVKYDNEATVGGSRLVLNGAGVRYKAIFKVYAAGLYMPAKTDNPDVVSATNAPRRMHIVMLRDIDANELGKLFTRGMQDNATREEFAKAIPATIQMGELFAARKKLASGDYFTVDWKPGEGTTISINGKPSLGPIKEPEFFSAMMKIWFGKQPADQALKDVLLGKSPAGSTRTRDR